MTKTAPQRVRFVTPVNSSGILPHAFTMTALVCFLLILSLRVAAQEPSTPLPPSSPKSAASFQPEILSLPAPVDSLTAPVVGGSNLITQTQADQIAGYLNEPGITLTRIFSKTSGDGKTATDFHAAADGKGRTISVMLVQYNGQQYLIGGYNPQSWHIVNSYTITLNDPERTAFLFNLTSDFVERQKLNTDPTCPSCGQYQTYNYPFYGPTFGGGHDLHVDNSLQSAYAYNHSYGTGLATNNILNIGVGYIPHPHIQVLGLEVFTVTDCTGYSFVGSYRVSDGPIWTSNPPTYTGQEAAALLFGGSSQDYAISVNPSLDPNTITHTAWMDGWGNITYFNNPAPENYKLSTFYNCGFGSCSFSAYVRDHVNTSKINYVWRKVSCNTAPVANNQSTTTDEDTPVAITLAASDAENDTLTYSVETQPLHGTLTGTAPDLEYSPNPDYNGTDSFSFKVNDGATDSNEAIVTITVNAVNDSPVLNPINDQTVDEGGPLVLDSPVFGSDPDTGDVSPDSLTYSLTQSPTGATIDPVTGVISWTPTEAQGGSVENPFVFTVRVTDSHTVFGERSFNVTASEVNQAPELVAFGNHTIDEQVAFSFNATASDTDMPANSLTYVLINGPAGASIDSSSGAFSWTPDETQGPGSFTFTVKVADNGTPALSDEQEITITVREVNRPPVLNSIANKSEYWGNIVSFTATASDPDLPANPLVFSLIGAPSGATIDTGSGAFSWTPSAAQIGAHTFTVRVTDNGTPNLFDERSVTLTTGRRPAALIYTGDGSEQYSDKQALSATLVDAGGGALNGSTLGSKTIGFAIGSQTTSASTDGLGVASTNLMLTQNPNISYTVDSAFAGDSSYLPSNDSDPFDIAQEDARAYYTGACFASTSCATCSSATVTLSATIKDITAETGDAATDSFAGDIRNARVTFINRDTNTVIASNVPIGLVNAGDTKVGTATYNWNVNIGSGDSASFTIGIIVTNYYTRNSSDENSVVTVSKPLGANFITGGGYLLLSNSAGFYAGGAGSKNNFGFNVKYNKNGSNLQGNINAIVRNAGRVYQIKGNAMTSLSVNGNKAVYNGKANIQDITDPLNPVSIDGNGTLQVKLTDAGEPGKSDTISLTIWNKNGGLWFASNWDGNTTIEQLLGGGNVVVR